MGMELLLFAIALPFWIAWSVHRGLRWRTNRPVVVRLEGEHVHVVEGIRTHVVALRDVTRVRVAENSNWTESRLVDAALTLFRRRRLLVKVPLSAAGLDVLLAALETRGVRVDHVLVEAPAYLD
jgi:hypothetical protein